MTAGVYIIQGSGLTVSGNASVTGSGVMIYNTHDNPSLYVVITTLDTAGATQRKTT